MYQDTVWAQQRLSPRWWDMKLWQKLQLLASLTRCLTAYSSLYVSVCALFQVKGEAIYSYVILKEGRSAEGIEADLVKLVRKVDWQRYLHQLVCLTVRFTGHRAICCSRQDSSCSCTSKDFVRKDHAEDSAQDCSWRVQ